jgi:signal recognition particle protein
MHARRWADDYPDTWEPEDHLPQHLIAAWEEQQRQRLLESMPAHAGGSNGKAARQQGRQQQHGGSGGAADGERAGKGERASRDRAAALVT